MKSPSLEELKALDVDLDDIQIAKSTIDHIVDGPTIPGGYVTLNELKQHLNVDFDHDDTYIASLVVPIQLAIESYLNKPLESLVTDGEIDRRVWHAIRIIAANYYANRESVTFGTPNIIPGHIQFLLQPLKRYT